MTAIDLIVAGQTIDVGSGHAITFQRATSRGFPEIRIVGLADESIVLGAGGAVVEATLTDTTVTMQDGSTVVYAPPQLVLSANGVRGRGGQLDRRVAPVSADVEVHLGTDADLTGNFSVSLTRPRRRGGSWSPPTRRRSPSMVVRSRPTWRSPNFPTSTAIRSSC